MRRRHALSGKRFSQLALAGAVLCAGLMLGARPAVAVVVSPANGSFESPTFTTTYALLLPEYWTASPNATYQLLQHAGYYPTPPHGDNVYGLEGGGASITGIQQDLGTMAARETYRFDAILISHRDGPTGSELPFRADYTISFYNATDSVVLASITEADFDPSALGKMKTLPAYFSYKATAADDGDTLRLIMETSVTGGTIRMGIDLVTVTTVPEPSAAALLATGLVGLACLAWRKRK